MTKWRNTQVYFLEKDGIRLTKHKLLLNHVYDARFLLLLKLLKKATLDFLSARWIMKQ
jgi:hypothetical protein